MDCHYSVSDLIRNFTDTRPSDLQEVALAAKSIMEIRDADLTVICLEGEVWLTRARDQEDHVIASGQRFALMLGDQAVVQALRASMIRLIRCEPVLHRWRRTTSRETWSIARRQGSISRRILT